MKAFPPEGQKLGDSDDAEIEKQILSARMDKGAMQQAGRDQIDDLSSAKSPRGTPAKRIKGASGGKKTGSLRKGNLEFPGDRTGATQQTKSDIEARKGFKKNKPGGLKDDERNPYVKRDVRQSRVDELGGDIEDQPKFSQKKFEKGLKDVGRIAKKGRDAQSQALKDIASSDPEGVSRPDEIEKKPFEKPENPFGKGDTPGQQKVKAMDKKSIKVTQEKDVELPKSFTDFSKKLKTYKSQKQQQDGGTPVTPRQPRFDNREPFQDDDLGQRTGKTGDKIVNTAPAGKGKDKGTPQKLRPIERPAVSGEFRGVGTGRRDIIPTSPKETNKRVATTVDQKKLNQAQSGVKDDGTYMTKDERRSAFAQSKGVDNVKKNLTKGGLPSELETGGGFDTGRSGESITRRPSKPDASPNVTVNVNQPKKDMDIKKQLDR